MKENGKPYLPVPIAPLSKLNVIIRKIKAKKDLITFLHGAMFSPFPVTWIKVIKNNHFTTWPGISPELITIHLAPLVATAEGHMQQERQGLQSTESTTRNKKKPLSTITNNIKDIQEEEDNAFPPLLTNNIGGKENSFSTHNIQKDIKEEEVHTFSPLKAIFKEIYNPLKEIQEEADLDAFLPFLIPNIKPKEVLYFLCDTKDLDVTYSDLTGIFLLQFSRGNNYHMIAYHPEANGILVEPIKNQQSKNLLTDGMF